MNTADAAPFPKRAYSIEEAITVSGFNRNRIYRLISENKLRTFKHGRRRYISAAALDECIRALEAESGVAA